MRAEIQTAYQHAVTAIADRLVENGVCIFLFHGVVDGVRTEVRNYTRKHLPQDEFATIIRQLQDRGTAVSMDDVVADRQGQRPLPAFAFAITFDDGFENNLTVAAPVLVDLRVPAAFYVTSDFVDRNRMSWIDRIEYAVERVPEGRLRLPWGERHFVDPASKRGVLDDVRAQVKSDSTIIPDEIASDIQHQLGCDEVWSSDHPLDRKLTWAQVRELAAVPGCVVGGHTHNHAILSFLSDEALRQEIETSLALLRDKAGIRCHHYSYPEGLDHCFDDRVISVLKQNEIVCCPTAIDGVNPPTVDLFHLRRISVI